MIAEKGPHRFVAEEPASLLGLIALFGVRGEEWQADDDEIDAFMRDFGVGAAILGFYEPQNIMPGGGVTLELSLEVKLRRPAI